MTKAATAAAVARVPPWPDTVTADQLGALLDITGRRVRALVTEGVFQRSASGRYDLQHCVRAYIGTLRAAAKAKPSTVDPVVAAAVLDGRRERVRLARAAADLKELELQVARRELVDADVIKVFHVGLMTALRNRIMGVPSEVKGRIPHLSIDEIEILEELIAAALKEVADGDDEDDAESEP